MDELKEWVTVAEIKMKENEQEKSSAMNVSGELSSLAGTIVSPHSSINNSVTSEMTTPKMLGLPKKGATNSGGMFRRTPLGMDSLNPYAEVFSRASVVQKNVSEEDTVVEKIWTKETKTEFVKNLGFYDKEQVNVEDGIREELRKGKGTMTWFKHLREANARLMNSEFGA
ncbi:unnamed protein product [Angiostrongylus costaricensis]|uniref:Uncharacterized protein n=1 Tax=Angiostrongylus costaricensis TaxID=334426 RepID=A0A0R3PG04_ANGCS|nr:unnamed protein product [Angiostrongylus costaricensis]